MSPFDPDWAAAPDPPGTVFEDAVWAAILLAIDPGLGGILLRAWANPARDEYVAGLRNLMPASAIFRKIPVSAADDRLLGGLDLPATLATGRPVMTRGLLADCEGGILQLAMAERLTAGTAARIAAAMDAGAGFAVVALDEGDGPDEAPPAAIPERLAFTVNGAMLAQQSEWPARSSILAAREFLASVQMDDQSITQLCAGAALCGIGSLRAPILALRAARAAAAFAQRQQVSEEDVTLAMRLVLAPRAKSLPSAEPEENPQNTAPEPQKTENVQPLEDQVLDAEKATLPPQLLAALASGLLPRRNTRGAGKSGSQLNPRRGRPAGVRSGVLQQGARLSIIETLRAAAPWQRLRAAPAGGARIAIRAEDFRIKKFKEQPRNVAIFAVDASGSAAVNRLAEAKGAVQLLLAECYVRRDEVALIAFRNRAAACLLPPTNALARARRALAALPGGGPTPLSHGIQAARMLADSERRKGHRPLLVLLTDGGANIGRDGMPGRAAAGADALSAARLCKAAGLSCLVIDTAPRPNPFVLKLSREMQAKYAPLPYADAGRLTRLVRAEGGFDARSLA